MSESLEADVSIILRARDEASEDVKAAVGRINNSYRDFNNQQGAVSRAFVLQNRTFTQTVDGLRVAGRIAGTVTSAFNSLNIMELRRLETTKALQRAQDNLNRALAEEGPNSERARAAAQALADVRKRAQLQQQQDYLQYGSIGIQTIGSFAQVAKTSTFARMASKVSPAFAAAGVTAAGLGVATGGTAAVAAGGFALGELEQRQLEEKGTTLLGVKPSGYGRLARFGRGSKDQKKIGNQNVNITNNINTQQELSLEDLMGVNEVFAGDY
jgi:hypothetical protein